MRARFFNLLALACVCLLDVQQPGPPVVPGVYRIGGGHYDLSWTGPTLAVDPHQGTAWQGYGRVVDGKLEIRWTLNGRQAIGVYEIAADRRSAAGAWGWIGDDGRAAEMLTRDDEPP